jgi:hypothetical protein
VGTGSAAITDYSFSNLVYVHNVNNPQLISAVNFTITPTTATTVRIQLAAGGAWYTCTNGAGNVNCMTTTPAATANAPDQLSIVAS